MNECKPHKSMVHPKNDGKNIFVLLTLTLTLFCIFIRVLNLDRIIINCINTHTLTALGTVVLDASVFTLHPNPSTPSHKNTS